MQMGERGGPHKMSGTHRRKRNAQKKRGGLGVFKSNQRRGVRLLRSFCATKGDTLSGGPKGTPKMERSEREVIGIEAGEDPDRRGQGDKREWSNQMNSHLEELG